MSRLTHPEIDEPAEDDAHCDECNHRVGECICNACWQCGEEDCNCEQTPYCTYRPWCRATEGLHKTPNGWICGDCQETHDRYCEYAQERDVWWPA